jgi:hypothetical protein
MNKDKLKPRLSVSRKQNIKEERITKKVIISFKDYVENALSKNPQSFKSWEEIGLLSTFLNYLTHLTELSFDEALQKKLIGIYSNFPSSSKYKQSDNFKNAKWAALKKFAGQKERVIGHLDNNIFYIVYLDKDHEFYIVEKKNT